jgi:hypothetical protein
MILLLSGWSGAGKDTVADFLTGYGFTKLAFADSLKEIVAEEFEIPLEWTKTQEGKRKTLACGKSVRELLIKRGQEIRQEQKNLGYFAEQVAKKIEKQDGKYVISDWRFLEELQTIREFCKAEKILTMRITRRGQEESQVKDLITEHYLDFFPFSYRLENPGTLDGLEKELQYYIEHVLCEKEVVDYENGTKGASDGGDNRV